MVRFGTTHLWLLLATLLFLAGTMWAVSRLSRRWQNVMFCVAAFLSAGGIFFRYGMGLSFEGGLTLGTLALELLQVCNFNFLLVILMLIPKFELARQYGVFFSMFAACTTLLHTPDVWSSRSWYDLYVLNSWLNHVFVIALPLWMMAARRLKPRKEYVWKVSLSVIAYFTIVAIISTWLISEGVITPEDSFSFIFVSEGVEIMELFHKWIPYPYFHLYPAIPIMVAFFVLLAWAFKRYRVEPYETTRKGSSETK